MPLMPAEPLVLLNWLIVLLSMQCNCFLLKCWFDKRVPQKRWSLHCNACNRVFVDKSKWLWFNIISLPMCSVLILLSICPCGKLLFTKKKQHTSPPCCLCCLLMSIAKGFLKKNLKQTHFHGLKERFCTYFVHV